MAPSPGRCVHSYPVLLSSRPTSAVLPALPTEAEAGHSLPREGELPERPGRAGPGPWGALALSLHGACGQGAEAQGGSCHLGSCDLAAALHQAPQLCGNPRHRETYQKWA